MGVLGVLFAPSVVFGAKCYGMISGSRKTDERHCNRQLVKSCHYSEGLISVKVFSQQTDHPRLRGLRRGTIKELR